MPSGFAKILLAVAIVAAILPPGYPAYIGAYISLGTALLALAIYGWRERTTFGHPTALAIVVAMLLVSATLPFVYRGADDLLAPVLILPMLTTVALGVLARPAGWTWSPTAFAAICVVAALIALVGGGYEYLVLGVYRPGLGNNPIHYGSLAVMAGGLSLVGVISGQSAWRYLFLLGPAFGLGAAMISDSRGPMVGAAALAAVGIGMLLRWLWREKLFRFSVLAVLCTSIGAAVFLAATGTSRVASILNTAADIFRFTGGSDDIRAALYASALATLKSSPLVGVGLGQILDMAPIMFPDRADAFGFDNLHADWANFGAMAGGMGLSAYLLLLIAPLLLLLNPVVRRDRPILLGAVLLSVGQLTLGVSNATFGILPQTTIYAVMLGYFLARARLLEVKTVSPGER